MMGSMLKNNGNKPDDSDGFQFGGKYKPSQNPYEVDMGGDEKEDLTWLIK